jgi:hypothetical protein
MSDYKSNREILPPTRICFEVTNVYGVTTKFDRIFSNDDDEMGLHIIIKEFKKFLSVMDFNEDDIKEYFIENTENI